MAKDPAFLYYDADASKDMAHMNRLERGAYIDVIHAQKKFGRLSLLIIQKVLGKDFENCWPTLELIMTKIENLFFIEWVEDSINKRKNFTESRRRNRQKKEENPAFSTYDKDINNISVSNEKDMKEHMNDHMVNENAIEIEEEKEIEIEKGKLKKNKSEKFLQFPTEKDIPPDLPEKHEKAAKEIYKTRWKIDLTTEQISKFWFVFKVQNVTGKRFYADVGDIYSYFINWIKIQKIEQNEPRNNQSKSARDRQTEASRAVLEDLSITHEFNQRGKGNI